MDPLLRRDQVLQNRYDVTVTSFLNRSQQTFVILLEILSWTFVLNLSKIGLFMFSWQHILETALMWNGAIQLSNYVAVTLFPNQSLQTFEVFLEIISGTSVQNFSRKKCFILLWQRILLRVLRQNRDIEIIDDVTVTSFAINLNKISYFCLLYQEASLYRTWRKSDKKQRSWKKWQMTSLWRPF